MRFHILSLPHVWVSREHGACAYTSKVVKGLKMLGSRGHEVILYGNEGSENPYGDVVQVLSESERRGFFGEFDRQKLYDLRWDGVEPYWRLSNERIIAAIKPRIRKGDFILTHAGGNCNQAVAEAFPGSYSGTAQTAMFVEWGCGYYGILSRYVVYESETHRSWAHGKRGNTMESNDDAVIFNYFDLDDFNVDADVEKRVRQKIGDEPYYLFVGRLIDSKGLGVVCDTTEEIGARVVFAGQGSGVKAHDDDPNVILFGHATIEERAVLMSNAIACFAPTHYREPFGGVAVEAQLCGTPAITTDHGAFVETVDRKWRCASHREFVEAALAAKELKFIDRQEIRKAAEAKFSLSAIAPQYERYFQRLLDRFGEGWHQMTPIKAEDIAAAPTKDFEADFWNGALNTYNEETKQLLYLREMGFPALRDWRTPHNFDAKQQSIIDFGGGPTSVLLKFVNLKRGLVIDPMKQPAWVASRYAAAGILYAEMPAEHANIIGAQDVDIALIYNCLQHCEDPEKVIANARANAKHLAVFEWINVPPHDGHPHMLTAEKLEAWCGRKGVVKRFADNECFGEAWVLRVDQP